MSAPTTPASEQPPPDCTHPFTVAFYGGLNPGAVCQCCGRVIARTALSDGGRDG